jgi:hypothetical protein
MELDPTFIWTPPNDWAYGCHPTSYEISIITWEPGDIWGFTPENSDIYYGFLDEIDPQTGGPVTSLSLGPLLEAVSRYGWQVTAYVDGGEIGSDRMLFWTGPICDTASLVAPDLIFPEDGAIFTSYQSLWLEAWYPQGQACLPEYYEFQLATDPDFTQLVPLRERGIYVDQPQPPNDFMDCTRYYWRARAFNNDGAGPFSDVFSFEIRNDIGCVLAPVNPEILGDTLCYLSPDHSSEVVQSLTSGQEVELQGYSVDPLWYVIDSPFLPGQECWVPQNALAELSPEVLAAYPLVTPPPTPPPPIPPTLPTATTPPKAADTKGPKVAGASASPNPALTTSPVTILASISDDSGVASATVYYKMGKGGYQKAGKMKSGGGNNYFLNIGTLTPAGTYTFRILAEDNLGNANCSTGNLDACPGGTFEVKIP